MGGNLPGFTPQSVSLDPLSSLLDEGIGADRSSESNEPRTSRRARGTSRTTPYQP